jgi:translation initiation factor 1
MSENPNAGSHIIYSTDHGKMCPACSRPLSDCVCSRIKKTSVFQSDGIARVRYETQGRKGKGVTVISGLAMNDDGLFKLARELKTRLGIGGTVKDHTIELQGDRREQAAQELRKKGYTVKG